ncbi:MAG TPA: MerR family transcriptional regulator [Luteibacter sp.]|uniref:MerR family transcriptional regulator n=1 Tax=Luteibacter sp. TaxID=1886636 RepID=UPI002BC6460A|nr:MerR family transcriptional regulator [Luteibacter sp.]HVI57017.1 MerR family transcriptional regulator [Luteibacter sp.]
MTKARNSIPLVGIGLYSFAEAATYIGAPSHQLRRWMNGRLWRSQLAGSGVDGIGFKDLIELRFVRALRAEGVSLAVVRRMFEIARQQRSSPYPFTSPHFRTDGKEIFLRTVDEIGERSLADPARQRVVIQKIIGSSIREGVELDSRGEATRWYPLRRSKAVVLDPSRGFGKPILSASGVPTIALATAVVAEGGDERRVARYFEVSLSCVRRAVQFEAERFR